MCLFSCRFLESTAPKQTEGHTATVAASSGHPQVDGVANRAISMLETVGKWTGAAAGFGVMVLCIWLEVDRIGQLYLNEHPDSSFAWDRLGGGLVVYPLVAMATTIGYFLGQALGREAAEPSTPL